jgi:phosphoserine phosphatase RsbU/P
VARLRDWIALGKSTLHSLDGNAVADLYSVEWPAARRTLIADYREEIENDPKRLRRFLRTKSALLYGLARRLAPIRRLLFFGAQIAFIVSVTALFSRTHVSLWIWEALVASFLALTFLLAMELIDKLKMRDELELARELQTSLIPKQLPHVPGLDLAAVNLIANTVGGDIYDFVPLPDGRLAILFGDASGHGMAAGLVMAVAHAAFRTQLDVDPDPALITGSLNRILCRAGGARSFFSCCYVLLSPDGSFVASVAGHPEVLKVRDGQVIERFGQGAYPLGIKPGLTWRATKGSLEPGDLLFFHSDGVTEARSIDGRDFGHDYLESILGWQSATSANEVMQTVLGEWRGFVGRGVLDDDVSIAVVRREAAPQA